MAQIFELVVNGEARRIEAPAETPLIYVLRNELASSARAMAAVSSNAAAAWS